MNLILDTERIWDRNSKAVITSQTITVGPLNDAQMYMTSKAITTIPFLEEQKSSRWRKNGLSQI